jgi:hypothetical protein
MCFPRAADLSVAATLEHGKHGRIVCKHIGLKADKPA